MLALCPWPQDDVSLILASWLVLSSLQGGVSSLSEAVAEVSLVSKNCT